MKHKHNYGFTIVELLIVIVVIAILASLTVVAYNGIRERAIYSATQQKFDTALKGVELYYADNGRYPSSNACAESPELNWCGWDQGTNDAFIPGLVPTYVPKLDNLDASLPKNDTFLYRSFGPTGSGTGTARFQLIRYRSINGAGLSSLEMTNSRLVTTSGYNGYAWGHRSDVNQPWY